MVAILTRQEGFLERDIAYTDIGRTAERERDGVFVCRYSDRIDEESY
jgi:hypothetical protein